MFANRTVARLVAPIFRPELQQLGGALDIQTRNAATLKTLQQRMRSINNMKKITKAMKMVATAKLKKDVKLMEQGLPFCKPVLNLMERIPREEKAGPITYLAITSDKGLCGGVNTQVNKRVRLGTYDEEAKGNPVKVMIVGGKGVVGLKRLIGDRFTTTIEEIAKAKWTFSSACIIAERLVHANPPRVKMVSNKFINMMAYETTIAHTLTLDEAKTMDRAEWSKAMDVYSFEPALYEVWEDLHEFYYGAAIYGAQLESSVTETAQRMGAMENASKNAGEMYEKVALQFNRARQAKITTELCEIISGAAAV